MGKFVTVKTITGYTAGGRPIFTETLTTSAKSGAIAQPAVPASTTALVNATSDDATVYITGGTVTVVAIDGVATGLIAGTFRVPAGSSITLTYSVAPTWAWFGD